MTYTYEDAVERAKSLRPLIPKPWRVVPIGNPADGYRLALGRDKDSEFRGYLDSDEDVKRLLKLYIQEVEAMVE